ncbi:MAG: iron ABC transporter permease [Oscillospiraceae bacterium]|nr:iron ABC transporter permease [Oscillospiraceae bacterium]
MKYSPISSTLRSKPGLVLLLGAALCLAAALASLCLGAASLSPAELWEAAFAKGATPASAILLFVRLPRTLGALAAGAGLACGGVILQAVFSNPLAGPNIIGVNSGAGLAAALCCALFPTAIWALPASAFAGALLAAAAVFTIARKSGASRMTMVLTGVAVSSVLGACTDAVVTLVPDALAGFNSFRIGGLAGVTLRQAGPAFLYILAGLALALMLSNELDILSLGEDTARSLGLHAGRARLILLLAAALMIGSAVSFAGLLGFVGLLAPHICRLLVGGESRRLLPASALFGAAFLTLCDLLSRLLFSPFELPVGILLSFLGGPFFLWLLLRQKGGRIHD